MTDTDTDHRREVEQNEGMVEYELSRLAANLMRICRGSGELYEFEGQIMGLANLFARHRHLTSHGVSPHIFDKALSYDPKIYIEDKDLADFQRAKSQIVRGALQVAASELTENNTTKHKGEEELIEGQMKWEALRKTR